MNKILLGVFVLSFSLLNCQQKEKNSDTVEVRVTNKNDSHKEDDRENITKVNLDDTKENTMDKEEANREIDVAISGDDLKDVEVTLKALEHLLQAMKRRDVVESGDLEDTLGPAYEPYPTLERVDMEALNELFSLAFQQAGVKKPTEEVFNASIKRIFQVDINNAQDKKRAWKKTDNIVLIVAYLHYNTILKEVVTNPYEIGYREQYTYYFDIENRFTLEMAIIPNYFMEVKSDQGIVYWDSVDQIYNKEKNEIYLRIDKFAIEFNKYVFYKDPSSFSWLLHNDPLSLSNLVKSFSFEAEPLLNGWLLNDMCKRMRKKEDEGNRYAILEIKNLFAIKNYQNQVEIREGLMQYIVKGTTLEDNDLLLMLDDYATELVDFENNYSEDLREEYTKEELYKIFAYAAYYSYQGFDKFEKGLGKYSSLRENWPNFCALTAIGQNDDVQEALKKNNYYNLPGLREAIERINTLK